MRTLIYLTATFFICHIFGLGNIWLGFTPILLLFSFFSFKKSFLWEIPLAVLSCSVINLAFADDVKTVLQVMMLISTVIISYASPRKLPLFFLVSIVALVVENEYSIAFVWATLWFGARNTFDYFITKKAPLQEYKS